jgi:hypothetical protein
MGLFSKKAKAPEPLVVWTGRRANINVDGTDQSTAAIAAYVHPRVADFRSQRDVGGIAEMLYEPAIPAVGIYVNGKRIGCLPSFYTEAGKKLLDRCVEYGYARLMVPVTFEWERKAGPFEAAVALPHSANIDSAQLVLLSQVPQ